jgi:hypothetical protein
MKKLILTFSLLLLSTGGALGQGRSDKCHVYVIDSKLAQKALDEATESKNASRAIKILGEFLPKIGEEETTTVHYPFPDSKLIVTASVFYTDEMMGSKNTQDSMLIGIVISPNAEQNALSNPDNAMAEVTYDDHTDKVRVKKFVRVRGRTYAVGLECDCNVKAESKPR